MQRLRHRRTYQCRSGQRLGKHVPVARQQIPSNATVGLQEWKICIFYVVRAEMIKARDRVSLVSSIRQFMKRGLESETEK
jgi:hypothetical protein